MYSQIQPISFFYINCYNKIKRIFTFKSVIDSVEHPATINLGNHIVQLFSGNTTIIIVYPSVKITSLSLRYSFNIYIIDCKCIKLKIWISLFSLIVKIGVDGKDRKSVV